MSSTEPSAKKEVRHNTRHRHRIGNSQGELTTLAPELFQVVIECRDEAEQRELFERLRGQGLRVRLLVL